MLVRQVSSWVTSGPKDHEVMIAQFTCEDDSNEKNHPELRPVIKKKLMKVSFEVKPSFSVFAASSEL